VPAGLKEIVLFDPLTRFPIAGPVAEAYLSLEQFEKMAIAA